MASCLLGVREGKEREEWREGREGKEWESERYSFEGFINSV
jgi:hypothetical protein